MSDIKLSVFLCVYFWKRRVVILVNFGIIVLLAFVFAFFIAKKEYRATITFLPPADEISSPLSMMGINLAPLSGTSILNEQIQTVFESVSLKRQIIEKFDFYKLFHLKKTKPGSFELALKLMKKYLSIDMKQSGTLGFEKTISFTVATYHQSPDTARMIGEYCFFLLDSAIQSISMNRAHRTRLFVEDQILINKRKLDSLQKEFECFQTANKAYSITEQQLLSLRTYAEIKSAAMLNELRLKAIRQEFSGNVPETRELQQNIDIYNRKLAEMEADEKPRVLPGLNLTAKIFPRYSNLIRDIEVQTQVIILLSKEYQQSRLQEAKDVSTLTVVDAAYTPTFKSRPKRSIIFIEIVIFEQAMLFLIFLIHFYLANVIMRNPKTQEFLKAIKEGTGP